MVISNTVVAQKNGKFSCPSIKDEKLVQTFFGELQANFSAREEARCRKVAIFPPTPLALAYSTVPTLYFFWVASQSQLIGPDFSQNFASSREDFSLANDIIRFGICENISD